MAFSSLKWKSFPSKNSHGQHMCHGIGAPHASLANMACSTPRINSEASCTPRLFMFGSCIKKQNNKYNDDF